jgi:ketosteroid isomerase-like protein
MGRPEREIPTPTAAEIERVVRGGFDAWNADDWEALESFAWPDASIVAPEGWPEPGEQKGWDKIRAQFERLKEPLRDEHVEVHWIEADYPYGFSHVDWVGTGEGSGIDFRIPMWMITTYEGLRYKRIEYHMDEEQARAAWEAVRGNG